jgi:hypothetical protein
MKKILTLVLMALCAGAFAQEKKDIVVKSDITDATVFISGAQVVRKKMVDIIPGKSTLKFVGLSPYLDAQSVQVKVNGQLTVLSVNHQLNYTDSAAQSKNIDQLLAKKKAIEDKLTVERTSLDIINEEFSFLKDNRAIGGKNQEVSLNNLKETSNFYRDRVAALKMKELEINKNIDNLKTEKRQLENQIKQISTTPKQPTSEVLVKVDAQSPIRCEIELSYFVNNAGWFPSYDIRAKSIEDPIELTYKANIHQNTLEDWKNVKLKLSSTNPSQGNVVPQLQTYFLNYSTTPPRYNVTSNQVSGRIIDAETNEAIPGATIIIKGSTIGTASDLNGGYSLSLPNNSCELQVSYVGYLPQVLRVNSSTMNVYLKPNMQKLDEVVVTAYGIQRDSEMEEAPRKGVGAAAKPLRIRGTSSIAVPVAQVESQTAVEFEIKTPYTISSDNKSTTVEIESYAVDAGFEYYCVPKVDKDAFLIANITNWEQYNLLEGEANIFFENTFVGKSVLDVRHLSDTLSLSLGRDKSVQVKREKAKELTTKKLFASKKEDSRTWHISVRNGKKAPISMILYDQVPVSTNDEIEVNTENLSGGNLNKDKGEVKWAFKLDPSAKKEIDLKYTIKYPKERTLNIE